MHNELMTLEHQWKKLNFCIYSCWSRCFSNLNAKDKLQGSMNILTMKNSGLPAVSRKQCFMSKNILLRLTTFFISLFNCTHSVWKSHKKSHSTLRAKRATFWVVDKSSLKMPKNGKFANLKLAVKQCYQTRQFGKF